MKSGSKKLAALTMTLLATLSLTACESSDDRTLAQGQACLDAATTAAQAQQCSNIVAGLTSQEAFMIQCSAIFVQQGLTGSRVANAIANVNAGSSSTDATTGLIAYLVFKNATPSADDAIAKCTSANSKAMLRLATAAKLATTIANAAGALGSIDPSSPNAAQQMASAVQSLVSSPSPTTNAAIGSIAVTANSAYCGDGSSYQNTQVCTDLQQAIGSSSDPATIGQALLSLMQNPH